MNIMKDSEKNKLKISLSLDLIKEITFKKIQPPDKYPTSLFFAVLKQLFKKFGHNPEIDNTVLNSGSEEISSKLKQLSTMPKASTYAIGAIINKIVSTMEEGAFVNVGIWHGFTLLSGMLNNENKKCIGVDNYNLKNKIKADGTPEYLGLKRFFYSMVDFWARTSFLRRFKKYKSDIHFFYEMDYRDYFRKIHKEPIGFYIYDAQHRYNDQLQGLELAEPFFTDNAIILVDDTNDSDNRQANFDFMEKSKFRYEIILDIRTYGNRHPTYWNGVTVFQKKGLKN